MGSTGAGSSSLDRKEFYWKNDFSSESIIGDIGSIQDPKIEEVDSDRRPRP